MGLLLDFTVTIITASSSSQRKKEKNKIIKKVRLALEGFFSCCHACLRQQTTDLFLGWFFQQRSRGSKEHSPESFCWPCPMLLVEELEFLHWFYKIKTATFSGELISPLPGNFAPSGMLSTPFYRTIYLEYRCFYK